ncbi:MAG: PAS domain S-box protein, partial [Syntrophothermus sp.]
VMRDISDQLRYIDDIREKELAYKTLLNTIPDVLVETDLSGKIVYINDVLVIKNYIASKDELLEHNIFEFLVAGDRERAYQYFMNFLSENPGTMEYKVKFSNNREVYCDVKGNLVTDPKGNPKSIIFVLRDLTEKRKAETQHRMLAHTVRSVSECISITDTSDHIIFVNEAFLKTYGYEEAELIGRPVSMVRSSSNDAALLASILPATLQGGWEGELINRRKDGYEFPIILSTSAVKNDAGEIVYMVGICKDISLQKKAERELEESRKRFQRYFENTTVGICVTSPDKGWIDVNNHLCDLLGYTKEELQTLRWDELTHPDDLPADIEQFELVLAGKIDSYLLDKRFIRKDNSIVYTSLYVAAEREPDGTLKHVLASLIDISSRKMAEEAIRQSEQRYRDLSNFLPVVIYETDLQGRLLFTNLAGYEVFGYTQLELQKGLYIWDMLEPSVAEKAAERFKILLASGEKSSSEYLMRKKDGELFHAIITSTAIYVDGALNGVRGAIIDISDRKKKEELRIANEAAQAMIKAQRHLSLLVDQSLVGFIEMNTGLIVTSWNPSAQRIFGFTAAEAIGNNVADLILEPQDKNRIRENLAEVMKNRGGFRNINRNITRDGRVIICEWHDTAIVDTDGQLLSIVSLVADITERIEAERALKESREKLKLFATHLQDAIEEERIQISRDLHDTLGQSLTGLKIYSARVRTKILRDHNGNKTEILASLDEMIQVIDEVMQEIRRISRQLRPRILDEEGLIPAISAQIHDLMTQSGISFKLTTETNHIPVNPKHKIEIYRIVQEALTNIIRHANASAAEIRIFRENGHSRIDIKDNGIGFEESKVLQKNTLGMLGMRERATVFGGILEISGKEGEGTIVSLQIPVHNQP